MLRAEDLMVGDYLTFTDVQNDSRCQKLKVVVIDGATNELLVSVDGDPTLDRIDIDDELCGIPITPEILDKNGFESDNNMFGLCDYELSKSYILENRGDRFCFVKRFPGHCHSTFFIIEVRFIHELQHCLKLCGINKTIEL